MLPRGEQSPRSGDGQIEDFEWLNYFVWFLIWGSYSLTGYGMKSLQWNFKLSCINYRYALVLAGNCFAVIGWPGLCLSPPSRSVLRPSPAHAASGVCNGSACTIAMANKGGSGCTPVHHMVTQSKRMENHDKISGCVTCENSVASECKTW